MANDKIDGVIVTPLKRIIDERGAVYHFMKWNDAGFCGFGEVYFSTVRPNAVKGWHRHHKITLNYVVPVGEIKLVLVKDGDQMELFVGARNYVRVTVPPEVWVGMKGISQEEAIVANCANWPHGQFPNEMDRCNPHTDSVDGVCYEWRRVDE